MILPDRYFGTAEEDVLTSSSLGVFFLDLDLAHITGMLDDFADEGLMSASHFAEDALDEIYESAVHPPLVENASTSTKRRAIRLDHAECAVH